MKKKLINALKLLSALSLGAFFIWLFVHNLTPGQLQDIFLSFKTANYWWIVAAICIGIISHLARCARWIMLMEPMGYRPRYMNVCFSMFSGYFFNLVFPRLGEVSRCGVLANYERIPFSKAFGTVVTERALDMFTFILLFISSIIFSSGRIREYIDNKLLEPLTQKFDHTISMGTIIAYATVAVIVLAVILFLFRQPIKRTRIYKKIITLLKGLWEGIQSLAYIKNAWLFVFYTLFIWACYLFMTYIVFFALPQTAHLGLDAGFSVFVFGSIGIIVVQGGIGIYPVIVAETLSLFSIVKTTGYAMGWLIWSGQNIMIIFAGIISLVLLPIYNKSRHVKA